MAQMRNIARMNGGKEMLSHFVEMQHFHGDPWDPEQDRRASDEAVEAEKEIIAVNKVSYLFACLDWECTACIFFYGRDEERRERL